LPDGADRVEKITAAAFDSKFDYQQHVFSWETRQAYANRFLKDRANFRYLSHSTGRALNELGRTNPKRVRKAQVLIPPPQEKMITRLYL
jgi:hypothetical protein